MHKRELSAEEQTLRTISQALLEQNLQRALVQAANKHIKLLTVASPKRQAEPEPTENALDARIHTALQAFTPQSEAPDGSFAHTLGQLHTVATSHLNNWLRAPLTASMYSSLHTQMLATESKVRSTGDTTSADSLAQAAQLMTDFIKLAPPMPREEEEARSERLKTDTRQRAKKRKPDTTPPSDSEGGPAR